MYCLFASSISLLCNTYLYMYHYLYMWVVYYIYFCSLYLQACIKLLVCICVWWSTSTMLNFYYLVCCCILSVCSMLEWNCILWWEIVNGMVNFYYLHWEYDMQFTQLRWYLVLTDLLRKSLLYSLVHRGVVSVCNVHGCNDILFWEIVL